MNASSLGGFLDWGWQTIWINTLSTLILVPVVLALCRIFDRRPAVQHLLWLLLLLKFMTPQLPGFAWVLPESIIGSPWKEASSFQQEPFRSSEITDWAPVRIEHPDFSTTPSPVYHSPNNEVAATDMPTAPPPTIALSPFQVLRVTLASVWLLGSGYFLVSICIDLRNQRRILLKATSANQRLSDIVHNVATQLGVRKLLPVLSSEIRSPFISCLGPVRLVWPKCLAASDPSSLRSLIAHEAAHVRRRDNVVAWVELFATLIWWWNPVFWFVRRRLRASAEMACDAIAIDAFPEDRCLYAEKLLELSAQFINGAQPLALAVGGDAPSTIERRLTMIVSEKGKSKTTLLGLLIVSMFAIGAIPNWTIAQGGGSPPPPKSTEWLLDSFFQRVPPTLQPTASEQPVAVGPSLNSQEKLVLRLKAMYLVAISEDRTTDADALAAAINAMTQNQSTGGDAATGTMSGANGTSTSEPWLRSPNSNDMPGGPGHLGIGAPITEIIRDLGPRRNWQIERLNLSSVDLIGQLRPYQDLAFRIKVTGNNDGPVWGSNAYTDDSSLNAAALHAGLVNHGSTSEIVAIIRPGLESYRGSEFHGVKTLDYHGYPGSVQLSPLSQHPDAPYLCDRRALRGNSDAYLSLNMLAGQAPLKPGTSIIVPLHGKDGAPIVGTDQYASDCNLDAAAVHAGVLESGESGFVKINLTEGLDQYVGSKRNGVESYPYGATNLSLRFEKLPTSKPKSGSDTTESQDHPQQNPVGGLPAGLSRGDDQPVQIGFEDGK